MRLALLARNPSLYSHRRIVEAARARGHEIDVINTLARAHEHHVEQADIVARRAQLPQYDAVIPRIGASITHYGLAVLRQFEVQGVFPLNESVAIGRSRDKLRALQLLAREGIGLPVTAFAHGPRRAEDVIKEVGGTPVRHQAAGGHAGRGVILAETAGLGQVDHRGLQRRQHEHPGAGVHQGGRRQRHPRAGRRRRGGRRACCDRGKTGEFRANLHRGGKAEAVRDLARKSGKTAIRSAEVLGLNVCRRRHAALGARAAGDGGELLARIRGMEQATGVDVAKGMIEFLAALPATARRRRGATANLTQSFVIVGDGARSL